MTLEVERIDIRVPDGLSLTFGDVARIIDERRDGPRWVELLRGRPGWVARNRWATSPTDRIDLSVRHAHLRGLYADGQRRAATAGERERGIPDWGTA